MSEKHVKAEPEKEEWKSFNENFILVYRQKIKNLKLNL
jgi:hypothetical protein